MLEVSFELGKESDDKTILDSSFNYDEKYYEIVVKHDGEEILLFTENVERVDPFPPFYLDCFWVKKMIEKAYELGAIDMRDYIDAACGFSLNHDFQMYELPKRR